MNRRRFLGTAAVGTAAARLALSATPASAAAVNDRVIVGVMGLSRGQALAVAFGKQPNVEVKYVCDVDATRADACAKSVENALARGPQAIADFRQILDDQAVDALVCAAPNHWHGPATILACAAGKHVYVEKPCCHNPREGELMVAAARKHKRAVQVGTQRRSGAGTEEAIARLQDGVIGRVYLARAWYNSARDRRVDCGSRYCQANRSQPECRAGGV